MPTPVVEAVVANLITALSAITGVTGLSVARNRDEDCTSFPTIVVFDGDLQSQEINHGRVDHTLDLDVEIWAQAADGAALGSAVNELFAKVVVAAIADRTRGGKAIDTAEQGRTFRIDRGEGGKPTALAVVAFRIVFATADGDPYTAVS